MASMSFSRRQCVQQPGAVGFPEHGRGRVASRTRLADGARDGREQRLQRVCQGIHPGRQCGAIHAPVDGQFECQCFTLQRLCAQRGRQALEGVGHALRRRAVAG